MADICGGRVETIGDRACLRLMREASIGRVAVVIDGFPVVMPVNYRLVADGDGFGIVIRTRPGGVLDQAVRAAFEWE
jgi:nitroimidazol reductase NimA-like FMN-containing flavoprotein (pyridoxamine 5'-phosphate oxidase superfamily)